MKYKEKQKAIQLRKKGVSINKIASTLGVSKGSVSSWVRDTELSLEQMEKLKKNSHEKVVIEKRRQSRLFNEQEKRNKIMDEAGRDIASLSHRDLKIIGAMLYWAEGRKRGNRFVSFSNSDPDMIILMMEFFKKVCNVPQGKFRGHIHIHSHLDKEKAEKYWSEVSGIPKSQFYKTYCKPSKASKGKMDSTPYGTLDITICDTRLFLTIMGWIAKVKKLT